MEKKAGAFHTGVYRNVFRDYGYAEADIEQKLADTWKQLIGGDQDVRIYYPSGDDMGYLLDTGNLDVRTEGQSYGMMMAVQMDDQELFNRIWKWTKTYMWHPEGRYKHYFAWSCNPDGTRLAQGPAPDGEEFFAMALLFATKRWGDGAEPFDYSSQAKQILTAVVHKGEAGEEGDPMWDPKNKLIKFVPETPWTDPSYHLPHFYELFALWGPAEDQQFWKEAAEASRAFLPLACHGQTGLAPEYSEYDGTPNFTRGHGNFYSDSYRVALNVALDHAWFAPGPWHVEQSRRIQEFFADIPMEEYQVYAVDGTIIPEPALHPEGLLATLASASLASSGPLARQYVDRFWNLPLRRGKRRYYDNCLYFFSLLALSGRYRIYR
ncbi:MAG: glycosyl hydrolase family 8 [Bacillota bacterium]|jgi:oligosaccharide reducing-end xylanase|nr:glycosyl hydrolase family 8 [Bacillota bacterium]HHT90659.1 xylanase [Bacillota bacterium]